MKTHSLFPPSFRDAVKEILTPTEQAKAIYSFDVLGDMALIEIPSALQKKKKKIANVLLKTNPRVTRVFEKVGEHAGKYRVEKIAWLAGEKRLETTHVEWGCRFSVNPNTVFYNPRLGTERQRIAKLVKPKQKVVVFFAGVGPYPILIAKHAKPAHVVAVEWNPKAIPYLEKNIHQNKVQNTVEALYGDVGKLKPRAEFDHVVMPAPDTALSHLSHAVKWLSKKGGIIHCYFFVEREWMNKEVNDKIETALSATKQKYSLAYVHRVSDFSAHKVQVCVGIRFAPKRK